ncbi:hypothetical protein ONS95_004096 [Cadophora gregata]|uniref:uncharacterized protein n=1 Tax=Cadophora gregata TaxID=51156 RepID=UPI0026DBC1AB|nr:uncharacterized protein ONS95_004096 [Cadophora gregata]KAK0105544.1 hypothetical protein ONS96_004930 [Cadophora gregata f. sp. sojae]KAK0105563.1 hypothetical protein ONS95_004096 [Cadophora gregata]
MSNPDPGDIKSQSQVAADSCTSTPPWPPAVEDASSFERASTIEHASPSFRPQRPSGNPSTCSGSRSWPRDQSRSGSTRCVSPSLSRISSGRSSRSISPDLGYVPHPPPLPSLSPGTLCPPPPAVPPPHHPRPPHPQARSPSPSHTIPSSPPPITIPPSLPIGCIPTDLDIEAPTEGLQPEPTPEQTLEARRRMVDDTTARIMLFLLENNRANHSSDYSYSLSFFPFFSNMEPGPEFTYPDNLPKCPIFVDRIGWFPPDEVARYLMMGYRVWDTCGRRLHFGGLPPGFDGLKAPIRYHAKTICTQDPRQVPDLHWQLRKGDLNRPRDSEEVENPMPWDIRLGVPEFSKEGTSLQLVQREWIRNRFENATPCYFQGDLFRFEHVGGWKLDVSPLKETPYDERSEWNIGPYARIGADIQCLTTMYPPTNVTLKGNTDPPKLCKLCSTLDFKDLFEWGLADVEIDFGTTEVLLGRKDCDFCRIIGTLCEDGLDHLRRGDSTSESDSQHGFNLSDPIQVLFVRDPAHCLSTKPCLVLKQSYHREYLGPIVSLRTVRGEIRGNMSLEDRRFVDFDKLKRMINKCASTHEVCKRDLRDDTEMILIDVNQMCLVQVRNVQYITLSYVWGNKPIFKTTTSNFSSLQIPGALDTVSTLTRDVAAVVRGLSIQYLWIDALCIIQDDESHKRTQISRMADIYGLSCLTVVALTGTSSDSPLPGVSTPRPQTLSVVHGMPFTFHLSGLTQTAHHQMYETRGWTFQERLISRRCLYFVDRQVHFECRHSCISDHEQIFPENDRGRYATPLSPLQPLHSLDTIDKFSLTAVETFTSIVCQYTARTLSYSSDIENAFLGIQAFMSRKLDWRFVAALPRGVFDWALLWLPRGQLKRRMWKSSDGREVRPPSWSWLGWEGQVSYGFYEYLHKPLFLRIQPRIEEITLQVGQERVQIRREQSALWHEEVSKNLRPSSESGLEIPAHERGGDILFTHSPSTSLYLHFAAEYIPAFHRIPSPVLPVPSHHHTPSTSFTTPPSLLPPAIHSIEFLTTGPSHGMVRPGLRHNNYNLTIQTVASTYEPQNIAVIAVADAEIQMTVRGGQFSEDKLFEERGRRVVMLIGRGGIGGEGKGEERGQEKEEEKEEEEELWERLAVGYLSIESWEAMESRKRAFRLS